MRRLLWTATPEAACRVLRNPAHQKCLADEHRVDVPRAYFKEQRHSNLPAYATHMRGLSQGQPLLTLLMTYSPLFLGAAKALGEQGTWDKVSLVVLHDLSTERDMQVHVDQFFETAEPGSLLLIQCDPRARLALEKLRVEAHASC